MDERSIVRVKIHSPATAVVDLDQPTKRAPDLSLKKRYTNMTGSYLEKAERRYLPSERVLSMLEAALANENEWKMTNTKRKSSILS